MPASARPRCSTSVESSKTCPRLTAFTNPTTNSYKRLVPGFEAPVNLAYSARNRSAAIRIPTYSPNPKAKRAEFRTPDPAANPYFAIAALLLAGLDGIQNRIDPGDPLDKNFMSCRRKNSPRYPACPIHCSALWRRWRRITNSSSKAMCLTKISSITGSK